MVRSQDFEATRNMCKTVKLGGIRPSLCPQGQPLSTLGSCGKGLGCPLEKSVQKSQTTCSKPIATSSHACISPYRPSIYFFKLGRNNFLSPIHGVLRDDSPGMTPLIGQKVIQQILDQSQLVS